MANQTQPLLPIFLKVTNESHKDILEKRKQKTAADKLAAAMAKEEAGSGNKGRLARKTPAGPKTGPISTIIGRPTPWGIAEKVETKRVSNFQKSKPKASEVTITKTKPKGKVYKQSAEEKNLLRQQEIKKILLKPKKPSTQSQQTQSVKPKGKTKPDALERYYQLLDDVKGKKVWLDPNGKVHVGTPKPGQSVLMDAVKYFETKMQIALAAKNPDNSLRKPREAAGPLKDILTINGGKASAKDIQLHERAARRDYTSALHPEYVKQTERELEQILNDYFKNPGVKAQDKAIAEEAINKTKSDTTTAKKIKQAPKKTFRGATQPEPVFKGGPGIAGLALGPLGAGGDFLNQTR